MTINVALDHDGTYSLMPDAWKAAIEIFRTAGANVFCITSRFPNVPIHGFPGEVYYTCGQPKWEWAFENNVHVDIWVDDWPACIGEHPERRGEEPAQAKQRRQIIKQVWPQLRFGP